jgi:uncharacterized membrane protein YGL010W
MRSLNQWLDEYSISHQNPTNQIIHKVFVPLIEFSLLGLMWLIPTPESFWEFPYLNWATIFSVIALSFYISLLNLKYVIGSIAMLLPMLFVIDLLKNSYGGIVVYFFLGVFVFSWIAQFIGHKIEGKKPSFLKDLLFLLIGPLWVLKSLYRKIGLDS